VQAAVALARQAATEFLKAADKEKDGIPQQEDIEQQTLVRLLKFAEPTLKTAKVNQRGVDVQVATSLNTDAETLSATLAESAVRIKVSAQRARSANNLRQIGIAMHVYHDAHGHLPPAVVTDKNGKPLYSWRVLLLPYFEQEQLFKQFNLEEPWDSEHNKSLLAKIPPVYAPVGGKTKEPYATYYQVMYGPRAAFKPGKKTRITADFPDGLSNTILAVEAGEPVPWTKPADVPYAPDKPLPRFGGLFPGLPKFNVVLADGSVRFLKRTISEKTLRAAITPDDGEPLGSDF
jgi:hypothetical protein